MADARVSSISFAHRGVTLLLAAVLVVSWATTVNAAAKKNQKPQTQITQVLSPVVYKKMKKAQDAMGSQDYKTARSWLDKIRSKQKNLNDYETATLWKLYAVLDRHVSHYDDAIKDYVNLLEVKNISPQMRRSTLVSVAQVYFLKKDYAAAAKVLHKWLAMVDQPQPQAYVLIAQAYYQMGEYQQSIKPLLKALHAARKQGKSIDTNWLGLLRAAYYETKQYEKSATVLKLMISMEPDNGDYWTQLAGMYGLMGKQKLRMEYMHIAYVNGLLSSPSQLRNMARLYLAQGVPQQGVDLLLKKIGDKTLEPSVKNFKLLARAMTMARDVKHSILVWKKLAEMTGESQDYLQLGQAHTGLGEWDKAASAYRNALRGKGVRSAGNLYMKLGTALFNAKDYSGAKTAFGKAATYSGTADSAKNWIKYVNTIRQQG